MVRSVTFSPDGRTLATGSADNDVTLWNLEYLFLSEKSSPLPQQQKIVVLPKFKKGDRVLYLQKSSKQSRWLYATVTSVDSSLNPPTYTIKLDDGTERDTEEQFIKADPSVRPHSVPTPVNTPPVPAATSPPLPVVKPQPPSPPSPPPIPKVTLDTELSKLDNEGLTDILHMIGETDATPENALKKKDMLKGLISDDFDGDLQKAVSAAAIKRMSKFMEQLGCCIVGKKRHLSAEEYAEEYEDNFGEMWKDFYAQFLPSKFPANASRSSKRIMVISPGMGMIANPAVGRMIWTAKFDVFVNYAVQNPEPLDQDGVDRQCEVILQDIKKFKPHALITGSKGGRYLLELWKRMEKTGSPLDGWNGAAVMINAHPACTRLPKNIPIVVVHGSKDTIFERGRESLDALISTGGHSSCLLYYTAGGGAPGHPADNHDKLLTLLDNDTLPRLLDAVIDKSIAVGTTNPEYNFMSTWRNLLQRKRKDSEDFLGHKTDQIVLKHWNNKTNSLATVEVVTQKSKEYECVETIFRTGGIEQSFHSKSMNWPAIPYVQNANILSVNRIENGGQELMWRSKYESLESSLHAEGMRMTGGVHTRWLFHGTDETSTWKIAKNPQSGFAPLASTAALWGRGVYFARDSEYSDAYGFARISSDGTKHIIMCLVLTGMSCLGFDKTLLHTKNRDNDRTYDSLIDCIANPEIFVVADGSCAYPAYVIHYK
jgi:hypothetical protein